MAVETRRPLAWDILSSVATKIQGGAREEAERLSREGQARQSGRSERVWWSQK
ncbi:MAG: hypothetical protein WCO00_05125 [Rhodospirillaceae bacterium]